MVPGLIFTLRRREPQPSVSPAHPTHSHYETTHPDFCPRWRSRNCPRPDLLWVLLRRSACSAVAQASRFQGASHHRLRKREVSISGQWFLRARSLNCYCSTTRRSHGRGRGFSSVRTSGYQISETFDSGASSPSSFRLSVVHRYIWTVSL